MADYNGWSNRETWNANLWLFSNDECLYRAAQQIVRQEDAPDAIAAALAQLAAETFGKDTPDGCILQNVDWLEIAINHFEDRKREEEYLGTVRND